jgi:sodium transport system permease protein
MRATWTVFKKEVFEIARDRRTLMAIMLGVLLTPLTFVAISQIAEHNASAPAKIGYAGTLPDGLESYLAGLNTNLTPTDDPEKAVRSGIIDVGITFGAAGAATLVYDPNRQGSSLAYANLANDIDGFNRSVELQRLKAQGIDPNSLVAVHLATVPLGSRTQAASNGLLSFLIPFLLINACLAGGLSAALDGSAGERERHTLESLLLTPARRSRILLGKIAAVSAVSLFSAAVSIGSMLLVLALVDFPGPNNTKIHVTLGLRPAMLMLWLAILLAGALSALMLTLGVLAKSYRQGSSYVTPLYVAAIIPPTILIAVPDWEPGIGYFLIPVFNAAVLLRDAILHAQVDWAHLAVTTVSLASTAGLAWVAARYLFTRESLLTKS